MANNKAGLHKEISAIFDGIPIPDNNSDNIVEQDQHSPSIDYAGYIPDEPSVTEQQAQSPPQPQQFPHVLPKLSLLEQLKAGTLKETIMSIPWQQTFEKIKKKLFIPKPGVSDARQKTMVLLIPILLVVLVVVFTRLLGTSTPETENPAALKLSNTAAFNDGINWEVPPVYPTTLRDPMQIGSVTTAQTATADLGLIVKAIVFSKDKPMASINGRTVCEGDKISGVTIVKISRDYIEFEANDKKWTQSVQ